MSKTKHQHFIPRSYLKNFAQNDNDKLFVEAKLKAELTPKKDLISIKDICVNKNIYTLPLKEGDNKYALEEYYAKEIDEVYPEVYGWLTNPEMVKIDPEQRGKIIMTTMSLFFRTPKFLNAGQRTNNIVLDYAVRNCQDKNGNVKLKFKEYDLNFHITQLEEVRDQLKIDNKIKFLQGHLADWHEFRKFKLFAAICVYKIYDNIDLITSDNPVFMHSVKGNPFQLFDPTNIISLPLDNKHYLTIFPNTEESMIDTIHRGDRDKWFALTTNLQIEKSAEDWILGKPGTVTAHLADQIKHNELTPENIKAVEMIKKRANDQMELVSLMEKNGPYHQIVVDKLNELLKDEVHRSDPEILKTGHQLAKYGCKVNLP
ncbi:DUF4238 domain-containing protein [Mucilaginibacter sp. cycad4]|uniref:DUF4238 domain-containing protein n=1 Tax=Mucilaginibacter sp. cycad4 TaxID=3342096 RepID=UPI002AAB2AD8|nr:DUF4238 domain-containing protein [Mucilaginibacter gossypii]WPV02167.1 DUF4238 domain-containing protein [Mucilaginibacter gossypii]